MPARLTMEQKTATVKETQKLIDQGVTQKEACQELGISPASFLKWKQLKADKPRKKLTVTDLPEVTADHGKLFMVLGNAQQLRQFMREMQ